MNLLNDEINIKSDLVNWFKTCKIRSLIIGTVPILAILYGKEFLDFIYKTVESQQFKDRILFLIDWFNIFNTLIPSSIIRKTLTMIITIVIIGVWMGVLYFKYFKKEPIEKAKQKINIFAHSSMGITQFKLDKKLSSENIIELDTIDLSQQFKKTNNDFMKLNKLVVLQDNEIEKFNSRINNDDRYGYMGIAHTPLILRAGYKVGDETNFILFHKKRDEDYFKTLNESTSYTPLIIEEKTIKDNSKELILSISTTFPIENNQLNILRPEEKSIVKFRTEDIGYDVITSKIQVNDYVMNILDEVRKIVRQNNIKKIHMVISSSVAFTFVLGRTLSSHYDPQIIIYHYDTSNTKKYPWGISLFEDCDDCIVIN